MRGELTQGAVIYIILMIVVILIGVVIVMNGRGFGINSLNALKNMDAKTKAALMNDNAAFSASCTDAAGGKVASEIDVKNLEFKITDLTGQSASTPKIYLIAEINNNVMSGRPGQNIDQNDPYLLTCTESACTNLGTVVFKSSLPIRVQGYVHLTAWRASPGMETVMNLLDSPDTTVIPKFSDVVEQHYSDYLGSVDISGSTDFSTVCKQADCEKCGQGIFNTCSRSECINLGSCWFDSGIVINSCNACPATNDCATYGTKSQCEDCSLQQCKWDTSTNTCAKPS